MTMEHVQTQWFTNGEFKMLPGKPEDHGLMATGSYTFERDEHQWTIFIAEEQAEPAVQVA